MTSISNIHRFQDLQVLMYFFLVVFSCISDVLQILTVKHISMLVIMFVCLLPCLLAWGLTALSAQIGYIAP